MASSSSFALSFLAGALTTANPCVLPVLPLVLGAAISKNKLGPVILALGLALSFAVVGATVASVGSLAGISVGALRTGGAILLIIAGIVALTPSLAEKVSGFLQPAATSGDRLINKLDGGSTIGLFLTGALLGLVWSPCSGPTLGAAIGLAAAEGASSAFPLFFVFGLGAAVPLILLGYLVRGYSHKREQGLVQWASRLKKASGVIFILLGVLILSGADKRLEAMLLDIAPSWIIDFGTSV